ncbi:Diamine acetyltransferase 1 [Castilleja foliolosa]|uniref:serine O-acetyltransferase n=1 Tax=Castilleja foliolosa TaxID=1961234 RepID=A0ABD3CBR7_9LAMI
MAECISRLCRFSPSDLNPCNPIYQHSLLTDNYKLPDYPCIFTPQEKNEDQIWLKIKQEAYFSSTNEPIMSDFYNTSILSHNSLESALANHLSIKLYNANLSKDVLYSVFLKALIESVEIQSAVRDDLRAVKDRDPACLTYTNCLLNFKGFLACQAHRLAHKFWIQGRTVLALLVQSRVSEAFAVDIHPGAKIGRGIVFDHATGIVIGETAVVGDGVTILHNVTLGGTGKGDGDRHPKIGDGVVIGAWAKVLGNVRLGERSVIGAGAVVLKEVPMGATAVGNPARLVGSR